MSAFGHPHSAVLYRTIPIPYSSSNPLLLPLTPQNLQSTSTHTHALLRLIAHPASCPTPLHAPKQSKDISPRRRPNPPPPTSSSRSSYQTDPHLFTLLIVPTPPFKSPPPPYFFPARFSPPPSAPSPHHPFHPISIPSQKPEPLQITPHPTPHPHNTPQTSHNQISRGMAFVGG